MKFKADHIHGGSRNSVYVFTGLVDKEDEGKPCKLIEGLTGRLSSVAFLVQEKMGFKLWWDEALTRPLMPVESRGAFRFDGLPSGTDWKGEIWAVPFKVDEDEKMFILSLDFDK